MICQGHKVRRLPRLLRFGVRRGSFQRGSSMGTTYHYASLTKREWFSTAALGGNSKLGGLGLNLTARGFELLLVRGPASPESTVQVGHWSGDAIAIIGDTDSDWLRYNDEFADLTADLIILDAFQDGFDVVGDASAADDSLFMQLCHLVATRQAPGLEARMRTKFGTRFLSRYQIWLARSWFRPRDLRDQDPNRENELSIVHPKAPPNQALQRTAATVLVCQGVRSQRLPRLLSLDVRRRGDPTT